MAGPVKSRQKKLLRKNVVLVFAHTAVTPLRRWFEGKTSNIFQFLRKLCMEINRKECVFVWRISLSSSLPVFRYRFMAPSIITSLCVFYWLLTVQLSVLARDKAAISRLLNETQTAFDFLSHSSAVKGVNIGLYVCFFSQWNIRHDARLRDRFNLVWGFSHQILLKSRRKIWSKIAIRLNHISLKIADLSFLNWIDSTFSFQFTKKENSTPKQSPQLT